MFFWSVHKILRDVYIIPELKLLFVVFYSEPTQMSGVEWFCILLILLVYLCIYLSLCNQWTAVNLMTNFAVNSFTENSILDVLLGFGWAPADCSKLFLLF